MIEQGAWAQGLRPFEDSQEIRVGARVALARMLRRECCDVNAARYAARSGKSGDEKTVKDDA